MVLLWFCLDGTLHYSNIQGYMTHQKLVSLYPFPHVLEREKISGLVPTVISVILWAGRRVTTKSLDKLSM